MTVYGGTPMTEEESGPLRDCLKNHWDEVGQEMYEMFSSHVKMTTTRNSHTCCPGGGTDVEVVLNSRPDIPDQLHCLLYFLVDGLMGGFINPTDIKTEENVECRKIMTPGRVDHKGRRRDVSQFCFVTNQIDKDEVIRYVYVYSKVRGVGRHGEIIWNRFVCDTQSMEEFPNKSVLGVVMNTQDTLSQ